MRTIGERLRSARVARGMSQDELADRLGVSKTTVSDWERGRMHPRVEVLPKIRALLDITLDDLICGHQEMRNVVQSYAKIQDTRGAWSGDGDQGAALNLTEARLLKQFRALPQNKKQALMVLIGEEE